MINFYLLFFNEFQPLFSNKNIKTHFIKITYGYQNSFFKNNNQYPFLQEASRIGATGESPTSRIQSSSSRSRNNSKLQTSVHLYDQAKGNLKTNLSLLKLVSKKHEYHFAAETEYSYLRWMETLRIATLSD